MIDLALSILFSSFIFLIFKLYKRYHINTVHAIIINYITACMVGIFFYNGHTSIDDIPYQSWFIGSLCLGVLFILVFNLMARTSQQLGVSAASVATKMSLVIPVLLGVWLYGESLGGIKIFGILLALTAVYFSSVKKSNLEVRANNWYLPLFVFLGSGIIDGSIKYLEEYHVSSEAFPIFSAVVFAAAALTGILFITVRGIRVWNKWKFKDLLGGIALGIPNFFSIYFLLRALQSPQMNSASVFTINNVAIVMLTTLLGIALFKESLSSKNWTGIAMAVLSIVLVAIF
ncbi:MAG: EamA family transporter [Flavobacteriaceae bacterium]